MDKHTTLSAEMAEAAEIDSGAALSAGENTETETRETDEVLPAWQGADTADKLSYAAALYGMPEDALVEDLLRRAKDDGTRWEEHLSVCRRRRDEGTAERLAAEFDELSARVPEIRQVRDLPQEVLDTARTEGVSLLDAYLRRWYDATRQAAEQRESARQAAEQSAGSLGGAFDEPDPRETAFSRSFRTALS